MLAYSIIMFLAMLVFLLIGIAIYNGKTELIHSYHQLKIENKAAYGKAFGKSLLVIAAALLVSGIIGLFGESDFIVLIAVAVLIIGMSIGIACIVAVQKKFNNGVF